MLTLDPDFFRGRLSEKFFDFIHLHSRAETDESMSSAISITAFHCKYCHSNKLTNQSAYIKSNSLIFGSSFSA
ncbi:hypothetical protein CYJ37_19885 [Bacillus sp. UMB0728]|nr:hypothetical protein CYJ37_19885 [Bacillus sp. UMB0728]